MSTDIKVFLEHLIDGKWVLVDVDPIYSSERNSKRRDYLYQIKLAQPNDLSEGAKYWLSGCDALEFVAKLDILEACTLWQQTEVVSNWIEMDLNSQLTTYFGLWEPDFDKWRVIVAV